MELINDMDKKIIQHGTKISLDKIEITEALEDKLWVKLSYEYKKIKYCRSYHTDKRGSALLTDIIENIKKDTESYEQIKSINYNESMLYMVWRNICERYDLYPEVEIHKKQIKGLTDILNYSLEDFIKNRLEEMPDITYEKMNNYVLNNYAKEMVI